MGYPTAQRVDGVNEQKAVVGVDLGVGLECLQFRVAEGKEDLYQGVGMGALRRKTEGRGEPDI